MPKSARTRPKSARKKPKSTSADASRPAEAAELLAEALARSTVRNPAAQRAHDGARASDLFDEAYEAARLADFETVLRVLKSVAHAEALLQALLLAQSDGEHGYTILHQAAWHGSERGVRELLRLGADAARLNAVGESSVDVAQAQGHATATEMLRAWSEAWAGWDAEELTILACLYHDERFADGESFLHERIELERDAADAAVAGTLFHKRLPSGLSMLEIAAHMHTPGCAMLLEAFGDARAAVAVQAQVGAGAEVPAPAPAAAAEDAAAESSGESASAEWPEDGWTTPCAGFMVCALCKGRSGPRGRWGVPGVHNPRASVRYPLMVCEPCQARHGVLAEGGGGGAVAGLEESWADGVVRLVRRPGYQDHLHVACMVHPALGEIGH